MIDGIAIEGGTDGVVLAKWAPGTVGVVVGALMDVEKVSVEDFCILVSPNIVAVTVAVGEFGQEII